MSSGGDPANNCNQARSLLDKAAACGAKLAVLPEFWPCLSSDEERKLRWAENDGRGPLQELLANQAAKHQMHICGGSIPMVSACKGKVSNSCLLYGPEGQRLARYDKIHLFRFAAPDHSYDETQSCIAGHEVVTVLTTIGRIGLAVCYDLRFPELFQQLELPDLIIIPAAFTVQTGAAHWETLVRARAIENQCHILAPAQCGSHHGNLRSWGHSLAVAPWGNVLVDAGSEPGVVLANIDPAQVLAARKRIPMAKARNL